MIEDFESTSLKLAMTGGKIITSDKYSGSQCYGLYQTINMSSFISFSFSVFCSNISFYYKQGAFSKLYFRMVIDSAQEMYTNASNNWTLFEKKLPIGNHKITFSLSNTDSAGRYGAVPFYIDLVNCTIPKFIIQDGNNLCTTGENDTIITQDSIPYTLDKFNNFGMNDIISLNIISIQKLVNQKYNIGLLK